MRDGSKHGEYGGPPTRNRHGQEAGRVGQGAASAQHSMTQGGICQGHVYGYRGGPELTLQG